MLKRLRVPMLPWMLMEAKRYLKGRIFSLGCVRVVSKVGTAIRRKEACLSRY